MTAEPIPAPLTEADMAFTYYGVHFDPIGEEGTPLLAVGHIDPKRMVAAANRYFRIDVGEWRGLDSYRCHGPWIDEVQHKHAVRFTECENAGDPEYHEADCGECAEMRRPHGWYVRWDTDPATPGAFPVTLLHV